MVFSWVEDERQDGMAQEGNKPSKKDRRAAAAAADPGTPTSQASGKSGGKGRGGRGRGGGKEKGASGENGDPPAPTAQGFRMVLAKWDDKNWCRNYALGSCPAGDGCGRTHKEHDDALKAELRLALEQKRAFARGAPPSPARPSTVSSSSVAQGGRRLAGDCNQWRMQGSCASGAQCRFLHDGSPADVSRMRRLRAAEARSKGQGKGKGRDSSPAARPSSAPRTPAPASSSSSGAQPSGAAPLLQRPPRRWAPSDLWANFKPSRSSDQRGTPAQVPSSFIQDLPGPHPSGLSDVFWA